MTTRTLPITLFLALPALLSGARSEISLAPEVSGKPRVLNIQGSFPGMRLLILDGIRPIGALVVDSSGEGRLAIGSLPAGKHVVHAVEWGSGKTIAGEYSFTLPGTHASGLVPGAPRTTDIRPVVVASGDLDGLGYPSLILAQANGVGLMRNIGGTFNSPVTLAALSEPTAIAVQDFDGDGLNDLAIAGGDGRVAILLNRGGGQFAPPQFFTAGVRPSAVASADFNGDGIPDLAIANRESNDVSILLGNGDGSFKPASTVPVGDSPRSLAVADFNNDGLPDLAVANFADDNISILFGNAKGGFRDGGAFLAGKAPVSLVTADFDENGAPDLAALSEADGSVTMLLNNGSGIFRAGASLENLSASLTSWLAARDVNGDGHTDLVLQSASELRVRTGNGDGSFDDGYMTSVAASSRLIALDDFNRDGRPDAAVIDPDGSLILMTGAVTFSGSIPQGGRTSTSASLSSMTFAVSPSGVSRVTPLAGVYPFSGKGSSGTLASPSETWGFNFDAFIAGKYWGSPNVADTGAHYGESQSASAFSITFTGGGPIDNASVTNGGNDNCTFGANLSVVTTFCVSDPFGDPLGSWPATVTPPASITFQAPSSSSYLGQSLGQLSYYFVTVFFDTTTPTAFTGFWTMAPVCSYSFNPFDAFVGPGTSSNNAVTVIPSLSTCQWISSSNSPWLSSNSNGTGTGTAIFNVTQANPSSSPRQGFLTIGGQSYTVTQAGAACQVNGVAPSGTSLLSSPATNNTFTVSVTPSDCQVSATVSADSPWITINGTNSGTVTYSINNNGSQFPRNGTITVTSAGASNGGQSFFYVSQAGTQGVTCFYSLAQSGATFLANPSPSNVGSVGITSPSSCPAWTSVSNVPSWLTVNVGSTTGAGNGTVFYTVAANPLASPRTGILTIGGQTYTVTQSGMGAAVTCTASAANPPLLLEGRTESLGNLQLSCSGLPAGGITADIILTLNTNVTNTVTGANTTNSTLSGSGIASQSGLLLSPTTLHWPGVSLTPSATSFTITNVLADASLLSAGSAIIGQVSVNSTVPVNVTNPSPPLGTPNTTLSFVLSPTTYPLASESISGTVKEVTLQESALNKFKVGTRFRLVLTGVPSGVMNAPVNFTSASGLTTAQLVTGADCAGLAGSMVTQGSYLQLPVSSNGVAVGIYQVTGLDSSNINTLIFPMLVTGSGGWSGIGVSGSYAPASPAGSTACGSSPQDPDSTQVPRYRDFSVPLQFSYLELTRSLTVSPTGVLSVLITVTNIGSQPWTGSINNAILPGLGSVGSVTASCSPGDNSCTASGGLLNWANKTISPQTPLALVATGAWTGPVGSSFIPAFSSSCSGAVSSTGSPQVGGGSGNNGGNSSSSCITAAMTPTGQFYTQTQSQPVSNGFTVTGIAVSGSSISNVILTLGGTTLVPTTLLTQQPDPNNMCGKNGWTSPDCINNNAIGYSFTFDTHQVPNGGPYPFQMVAVDNAGNRSAALPPVNSPTISINNTVTANVTISGTVSVSPGGAALSGVTVNLTGSSTMQATTGPSGTYTFPNLPSTGSYTVTASLSGFNISTTTSFPIVNPSTNQTVNFSATAQVTGNGLDFYPITPCRIADTRVSSFPSGFGPPAFGNQEVRTYNILASSCAAGIPSNVSAYSINFTVVPPSGGPQSNLTVFPTPAGTPTIPNISTLNYASNVVANAAIVPAGVNGEIDVYANFATNVLFDINGYFAAPRTSGLTFFPVSPCRVADTRVSSFPAGFGPPSFTANETLAYPMLSSPCAAGIPSSVAAYSINFTVVPPSTGTAANLTVFPQPAGAPTVPNISTLNYYGLVVANAAIVPAGTNGGIDVFANLPTNVLFDLNGYFATPTTGLHFYPITPCRIADTRVSAFPSGFGPPALVAGAIRTFNVLNSSCSASIPSTVAAYSLNFTVVPPSGGPAANLTTWAAGSNTVPNISTLNYYGSVVANAAIVPAGTNGSINVFANFTTDMLFDINGYFAP